jgi:hypothetical protein
MAAAADTAALVTLAGELATLLERETALVRMLKIAEIAPLQAEKTRLTQLFHKAMKQAPPSTASKPWLAIGKRLAQAAIDNERALRVGRAATERLIAAVITAVKQSRHPVASYAPKRGLLRAPELAGISLDRRF